MVTSLTRTILDNNPDLEATWTSLTPMGRLGVPEDLKGAIVFLASDASAFVTGTEVKVDGGYWYVFTDSLRSCMALHQPDLSVFFARTARLKKATF